MMMPITERRRCLVEAFDKKRCLDNIYFLAKQKGKKIGELEELAGVSTGYLSRANKEENTSKLTIDLIVAIAQALGVSIDKLVSFDLTGISSNERRFVDFIEKLELVTVKGDVVWDKQSPPSLDDIECRPDGTTNLQFINHRNNVPFYTSYFFPDHQSDLSGDYYTYDMDEDVQIVLTKVKHADTQGDDFELYFYVDSHYAGYSLEPVCGTCPTKETQFDTILSHLYETVVEACKNVKLSPLVRNIISRYMGDQINDVVGSDDDGELPF